MIKHVLWGVGVALYVLLLVWWVMREAGYIPDRPPAHEINPLTKVCEAPYQAPLEELK